MEPNKLFTSATDKLRKRSRENASVPMVVMDEKTWKELPEELLELVILRLPIATFFEFRSVCRKWNSLVDSQRFSQRWAENAGNQPWFFATSNGRVNTGAMYDPCMKKWHPCKVPPDSTLFPKASVGGLVCCIDFRSPYIHVGNPLTQTWKIVRCCGFTSTGIVSNTSNGCKIVSLYRSGKYEVYDSLTSTIRQGVVPAKITLPLLTYSKSAVSMENVVYFLRSNPDGIVSYNETSGAWDQFLIPAPPNIIKDSLALAECEGRILLVGLETKNVEKFVRILELQTTTLTWIEFDRMPSSWCSDFVDKKVRLICLGLKGSLMLLLRAHRINRIFMYDAMSKKWSDVPRCILPGDRRFRMIDGGIAFYPSLLDAP